MTDPKVPSVEDSIADGSQPFQGWGADLVQGYQRKRRKKRRRPQADGAPLTLNSLMDIVTILLVYLLKSYATSPIDVTEPSIELPISTSIENVEDATVVMITGQEKRVSNPQNPAQTVIVPNTPTIVVDGTPVVQLDSATYRIPADQKDTKTGGFVVLPLREKLKEAKEMQSLAAEVSETVGFSGKVVILADRRTPYRVLTDVLVTCGEAGFGEFKFAIVKEKG